MTLDEWLNLVPRATALLDKLANGEEFSAAAGSLIEAVTEARKLIASAVSEMKQLGKEV